MSELLSYYQQQAAEQFSTVPWVLQQQENALSDFLRLGFPHRHLEDWKYTRVDAFLQQLFPTVQADFSLNDSMAVACPFELNQHILLHHGPFSPGNGHPADPGLPGQMITTVDIRPVPCGVEAHFVQENIPVQIPLEACYLGWQESLTLLAQLVEPEIPG